MSTWIITILLIIGPFVIGLRSKNYQQTKSNGKWLFYAKDIISCLLILAVIYFINPTAYYRLDFEAIGNGIHVNEILVSAIIPIFFIPLIFSLTRLQYNSSKEFLENKDLFGYPLIFFPNSLKEYLLFCFYIFVGVLFEEMIARQFMFYYFNNALGLRGDMLLITSAILFAVGHLYQGWKGVALNFLLGIILGKIFQIKETILYPMILHLAINMTVLVIAYRRMYYLKKNEID